MIDTSTASTIDVPDAPAIPGLVFRRFRDRSDFAHIADIANRAGLADGNTDIRTPEAMEEQYAHLTNSDLHHDLLLVDVDQVTIGYGRVEWWDETAGNRIYSLFGHIVPEWRRQGIGTAMLRCNEARIREIASTNATDLPCFLQSYAGDTAIGAETLLKQTGYIATRHGFDMERDLSEPIGSTALPVGIEVRSPTPEHYRQIWDAEVEAFRDHWGFREPSETDYAGWLAWPNLAPHLWQVAWEGDEIVGMVLNFINPEENATLNRERGYTEGISVRRPWRKKGVASALINRSLLMFREMGMTEAALGVDAENLSGALRVYERCGFNVVKRGTTYRKSMKLEKEEGGIKATVEWL